MNLGIRAVLYTVRKWKKTVLLPLSQRAASQAVMLVISQQWLLFLRLLMQ